MPEKEEVGAPSEDELLARWAPNDEFYLDDPPNEALAELQEMHIALEPQGSKIIYIEE
jgi:hypothetical protein